jgi:integrase
MYERSARRYLLPHLGGHQLRNVRPVQLTAWLSALRAEGIGDRTVEIAGVTAHKLLKAALDLELISRNPADNSAVRSARPRASAPEQVIWTTEQTRQFLDSQRDDRLSALWRLAAMTGLRRGELAGLSWTDIDLETGTLRVSSTRVVVDYKVVLSEPKTEGSRRTIALDPATVAALRSHRNRQREEQLSFGIRWDPAGLVFTRENGEAYHPQRFTQMLVAKAKATGLPPIKLHALRHGHATTALEAGVPLKVVSDRLGHSSIAITADTYSHVSVEVDRAAAEQIAAAVDAGLPI